MATISENLYVDNILQYASNYGSNYFWQPITYYRTTGAQTGAHFTWFGHNGNNNSCCLPLPLFGVNGTGSKLTISAQMYMPESHEFYWAICSSTANKALYQNRSPVSSSQDNTQIATGTFYLAQYQSSTHVGNGIIEISATFPVGENLYLFLWAKETGNAAPHIYGTATITAEYTEPAPPVEQGIVHIGDGSTWNDYAIYIGNGNTFDQYEAYIGTGNSWVLLT